jgi:hypothetical protein
MTFERLQPVGPNPPIRLEPPVEIDQGLESDPVHPTLSVGPYRYQAGGAQNAEMFGHSRLADAQGPDHVTDGPLLLTEVLENPTTVVIGQDLERVHWVIITNVVI